MFYRLNDIIEHHRKKIKAELLDQLLKQYCNDIYGCPPEVTETGFLSGGTPPNITLFEKIIDFVGLYR